MEKAKKKRIQKYITWGAMALVVALLAVMPLLARTEAEEDGPKATIHSGTVQTGSVGTTLHGGGTLEARDAEDVILPTGVKITEFLVKNGDIVAEGTPLAVVDKVSVMNAVTQVQETLDYLREEMADAKNEKVAGTISATAGGRVKKVYAQAGDSVEQVMLEHGALALLSLDGMMAVSLECDTQLRTGDSVTVTLSDGTDLSGRVETNLSGELVVTVEDEGYAIGEAVTVTGMDGSVIGKGELYVHNAWKASGYAGTISTVYAKEETRVSEGASLFALKDREFAGQLEYLAAQHREYEELLQELFQMYTTGTIDAPCEGMISGLDEDSPHLLAAEEDGWEAELLENDSEGKGWTIVLLSNGTEDKCTKDKDCPLKPDSLAHEEGCIGACDKDMNCDATVHYGSCIKSCDHADKKEDCDAAGPHYNDCIRSCSSATAEDTCPASKHELSCIESCITSDGTAVCPGTGVHHADCIKNCDKTEDCLGGKNHYASCVTHCTGGQDCEAINHKASCDLYGLTYTAYAAKVTASGESLVVKMDKATVYQVEAGDSGWKLVNPTAINTNLMISDAIIPSKLKCSPGDLILILTGTDAGGTVVVSNKVVVYQKAAQQLPDGMEGFPGMGDLEDMLAGMMGQLGGMGGFGGFGSMSGLYGSGSAAAAGQSLFDLNGSVLMTVTPRQTMNLTITVDEQEISLLQLGQRAEVKVTALRNQTFEAEVTGISRSGTNNGGSSKFTAELSMDMTADMLDGMSASVMIPMYTKMDVLTIPVAALVEDGARTVVYTALDEETGEPAAPVEVTIGSSDGTTAEVLSGLSSGDTYYYSYYDTLELSTAVEAEQFSFGG